MPSIEKTVLVPFTCEQMYNLVRDVPTYPQFLPWCAAAGIQTLGPQEDLASVTLNFKGIKQTFTTKNTLNPCQTLHMHLQEGPFSSLEGSWQFVPIGSEACKIHFKLHYQFSSALLARLLGPVFHGVANAMVDGFVARAECLYPPPNVG
jgi:ribosome-associated toxin RatA of RatAB toxin-antitoxin module